MAPSLWPLLDPGIISDGKGNSMQLPKQHDPKLPRISDLDLTKPAFTLDWDWPEFPLNLRAKVYGHVNPTHAALYAIMHYNGPVVMYDPLLKLKIQRNRQQRRLWYRLRREVA